MKALQKILRTVLIVLIIGGGIFLYYNGKELSLWSHLMKSPVAQMHEMLDDNISHVLSPLSASGNEDVFPGIVELRAKVVSLHNATPPLNEDVYRQAIQVCDLLAIAANERDAYVKRLERNRDATKPLLIANEKRSTTYAAANAHLGSGSSSGGSESTPQQQAKKDDGHLTQEQDMDQRMRHNELAAIQQWNEKMNPYRRMIAMRYPNFSLAAEQ